MSEDKNITLEEKIKAIIDSPEIKSGEKNG